MQVKVFVLVIFFLLPNGEEKASMARVVQCPTEAMLTLSLKKLADKGEIKSGRAFCQQLDMGREA